MKKKNQESLRFGERCKKAWKNIYEYEKEVDKK